MTIERAKELQANIAKEAIALLVIHGDAIEVAQYEKSVSLIGEAWGIPAEDTENQLALIRKEWEAVTDGPAPGEIDHVLPETELPMNATGTETLDNIWGLFETSLRLDSAGKRATLFNLARELEECQNLLDWIEQTPAEKQVCMAPTN